MSKVLNIESVKETTLYKELINRANEDSKAFVSALPELCNEASNRAKLIPKFFSEYTLHDKTHFLRVTELMSYVLGKGLQQLNDIEIGLLILSAFYHDQGMLIDTSEYNKLSEDEEYLIFKDDWIIEHSNYIEIKKQLDLPFISELERDRLMKLLNELEVAMLTDFLRESHGQRSHDYILEKLGSDRALTICGINISNYLAKICLSHVKSVDWLTANNGFNYDENIGTYKINTVFLALILRLADILDFDSDRTPDVLFKSIHFTNRISITEWQKHRSVKGWEISKDIIRFTMYFEHPVYEKSANDFLDWIDKELNYSHALIRKFPQKVSNYTIEIAEKVDRSRLGPKNENYIYHDLEFNLSRNEIIKLLMTDKLYSNTSLFLRELLQNSLDALRLRKANYQKDGLVWNLGKVIFRHFLDENDEEVIECLDNGCGMDEEIVSKYLGKVGRSFYRSPEFERHRVKLREKGVDFEPCSQFGIGFMSCFMIGDRIQIFTRKDYGQGKENGKPLIIEINGIGGLITIKEGESSQPIGTKVKIFCRIKPLFFDKYSDKIRLLLTLKGYALATEFPIEAICEIEEIKGRLLIPEVIDKKETFLESLNLKCLRTYEVDLSTLNKNLTGFLRQSFLIDDSGLPCIENSEAKWEMTVDRKTWKDRESANMNLVIKKTNKYTVFSQYHNLDKGHSVCVDGILVCGFPGRSQHLEYEMKELGQIISRIFSEHPYTIDIRGDIKPELSPARTPIERNGVFTETLFGWKIVQKLVSRGSAIIWEQILNLSDQGLPPDIFWKLIILYRGNIKYVKSSLLFKKLKLPIINNNWIELSNISSFSVNDESIVIKDFMGEIHSIRISDEIINWGKFYDNKIDFNFLILELLTSISKIEINNHTQELVLRTVFNEDETPADNEILGRIKAIPFDGCGRDYITTTRYNHIINDNNPIVKIARKSELKKQKDELQEFASSLLSNICRLIQHSNEQGETFSTSVSSRQLKSTSIFYMNINWSKYSDDLKPPYKIFINEESSIVITDEVFKNWAKQKVN